MCVNERHTLLSSFSVKRGCKGSQKIFQAWFLVTSEIKKLLMSNLEALRILVKRNFDDVGLSMVQIVG